jgi:hypothetical protein
VSALAGASARFHDRKATSNTPAPADPAIHNLLDT